MKWYELVRGLASQCEGDQLMKVIFNNSEKSGQLSEVVNFRRFYCTKFAVML